MQPKVLNQHNKVFKKCGITPDLKKKNVNYNL